jgi:oryzin
MVRFAQLALFLWAAIPAYGLPANKRAPAIVPGSYIVTLKSDLVKPQVDGHLSWVSDVHARSPSRRQTTGINKIWTENFKGYSGHFDDATIEEIRNSADVS